MSEEKRDFFAYLRNMITLGASDLHLKVGAPPTYRIDGVLFAMDESACGASELEELSNAILTRQHREDYAKELELDIAFSIPGTARYRVNFCCQRVSGCSISPKMRSMQTFRNPAVRAA